MMIPKPPPLLTSLQIQYWTPLRRRVLTTKSWRDTTSSDTNVWVHLVSGHKWCHSIGWCYFDASHHAGATAMCLLNLDQICPCIFRSLWFSAHLPEMAHSVAVVICLIIQRCRWFFKSGWASSNAVGIICPPGCSRVNWTPKFRWACGSTGSKSYFTTYTFSGTFTKQILVWRERFQLIQILVGFLLVYFVTNFSLLFRLAVALVLVWKLEIFWTFKAFSSPMCDVDF